VPSFAAAAAALETELTLPGLAQSVVLTRTSGRASAMPEGETLSAFAQTGAVLAIHLSVHVLAKVIAELTPHYGDDLPRGRGVARELAGPAHRACDLGHARGIARRRA